MRPWSSALAMIIAAWVTAAPAGAQVANEPPVKFVDVAANAGLTFRHENGATPEKYMPETMGAGALIFDFDSDGWPDIFLVNGGSFVDEQVAASARHGLFRNQGDGNFLDVSDGSGIGVSDYGMGACSADYDNDGWVDLYVTSVGMNRLYHNDGTGRFVDVTDAAGVGASDWSASCAFADIDNDGYVDLYVTNYVDFAIDNNKRCGALRDLPTYCHPNVYNGVPDVLYRNRGDGTFEDISQAAGIARSDGNGLGVVFTDYDDDGWIDIYVANDSVPNFLFRNLGGRQFEETGFWAGVAVNSDGAPQAGMGTDAGDVDGDGLPDLIVTNLDSETHSLYRNLGAGLFSDITFLSGVGEATVPFVGFGTAFLDYDNDMDLDLAIANGDVLDNVGLMRPDKSYRQENLLLENDGTGRFRSVAEAAGSALSVRSPSRGLAVGDLDNDGDLDMLIANIAETPQLLRNEVGNERNALLVRTIGSSSNRDGIGARVRAVIGDRTLTREVRAGSSYLSQSDLRIHFGLGDAEHVDRLEIRWPGGTTDVLSDVGANQILTVVEGTGLTDRRPLPVQAPERN
jgi:enediyne biosynthesis protein E4